MTDNSASRHAILSKIRGARGARSLEATLEDYEGIDRSYIHSGRLNAGERLQMFEERLLEYDARVRRITRVALPDVIADRIRERKYPRMAIPAGTPSAWLPDSISFIEADNLSNLEIDNQCQGLLSGCTVAIALTGTIVLQNAQAQGPRKLSLIPDYHLCIVLSEQIVETVPEAFDRLTATSNLPSTFVSGPSATADIEMTRIKGVHGPRFLDVLIAT